MTERPESPDALLDLAEQAHRVMEADRAARWERIRRDADTIAEHLTETMLPADMRAAGIRIEWAEGE